MTQDNVEPRPTNPNSTTVQVEAPTPSLESAPKPRKDVEILMRGPLHEAFANVHQTNPVAGPVMEQRPPEPIEELLPEYKPDGENINWILGYWSWDDETSQFIWVSGLWREVPPGQRWIPGYWEEAKPGYRWVSGFWTAAETEELSYLPSPPESLEQGPSSAAPSDNYFYAPGNWTYRSESYQWQPGYWQPCVENWVWIPARYVWTPCGYVYCAGFWDRLFQDRGVCFAPVRFLQPVYYRPQFYYRPVCRVVTDVNIFVHLFVRPSCGHYYFGDWYDDRYARRGYCAWVNYPSRYRGYDSLYNYYHYGHTPYRNSTVIQWAENEHRNCQDHADYRPKHTYRADMHRDREHSRDNDHGGWQVSSDHTDPLVEDLNRHVRQIESEQNGEQGKARVRYHRVDDADRKFARETAVPIRDLQAARHKVETSRATKTVPLGRQAATELLNGRIKAPKSDVKLVLPKSNEIERRVMHAGPRPERVDTNPAAEKRLVSGIPNISRALPPNKGPSIEGRSARRAEGENSNRSSDAKDSATAGGMNPRRLSGETLEHKVAPRESANRPADRKNVGAEIRPREISQSEPQKRLPESNAVEKLPRSNPVERNRARNSVAPSGSPPVDVPREELKRSPQSGQTQSRARGMEKQGNVISQSPPRQVQSQAKIERSRVESQPRVERRIESQPKIERRQMDAQPKIDRRASEPRQQSSRQSNQDSNSNRSSPANNRGSESRREGDMPKKD